MSLKWFQTVAKLLVFPVLGVLLIAGCNGGAHLIAITVTPGNPSLAPGATQQFKATAMFGDGHTADITGTVTWSSGTTSVAMISTSGLATAVTSGSSVITATSGKISGNTTLKVVALVSIAVTPNPASVGLGGTVQLTATGTYSDNSTADLTNKVTWNSSSMANATIAATGLAKGVLQGSSNITASLGAIVSPIDVLTVTAPTLQSIAISPMNPTIAVGATVDFTATAVFTDGSMVPLKTGVTWGSGTTSTASIVASNGVAVALATGTSQITAMYQGEPGNTTLTVQPAVARFAYVGGTTDSNTAVYAVRPSPTAFLPIATNANGNVPSQVIPEPSGRFVYLLEANAIVTISIDAVSGRFTGTPSTLTTGVNSNFGVIDPTGQYLYVVGSTVTANNLLSAYLINLTDGSLTAIGSPISVGTSLISVITDRTGKFLYTVDSTGNQVFAYAIGAGGALTPLATPFYSTGALPQYPAIDPTNTYLYIPNQTDTSTSGYKINADGSLTPLNGGTAFTTGIGSGPTYAAIDATDKFFLVSNANDNTVSVLAIGANGALGAAVAGSPFPTGVTPLAVAIDPDNTTVAVANLLGNSISTYSFNSTTGALTPATLPQVESPAGVFYISYGIGVKSPSVNPGAVYAANSVSGDISAFTSTAASGALTAAASSPITGIAGNSFAANDSQGNLLFVGGSTGTQAAGFSINQSTGGLTQLSGSPFSITGTDMASALSVVPTDTVAYTLDVTTGSVVQNAVDTGTASVAGGGTATLAFVGANNLAADPEGDLLYALGQNSTNSIQPFTTSLLSGGVTASIQMPALPGNWTAGAVDGSSQYFVAVDSTAKTVQAFSITPVGTGLGTDGALTAMGSPVSLSGSGPWVVAFDTQDRAVFVADQKAGTITPYPFTFATGAIGAAGAPVTASANGITNITAEISGNYLYAGVKAAAAAGSKGAVAVYSIGAGGALTAVASPYTTGTGNPGVAATNVVQ